MVSTAGRPAAPASSFTAGAWCADASARVAEQGATGSAAAGVGAEPGSEAQTGTGVEAEAGAEPGTETGTETARDGPWNRPGLRERLVAFARRLVGESDAEDLAQEALVRAACNLRRLRSADRTEAWLFRICRHAAIDHLRSRRVRKGVWTPMPADMGEWIAGPVPVLAGAPAAPAYAELAAHQGLLLRLHHVCGLSQTRLCLHSGLTAPALRVRLFRARRRLSRGPPRARDHSQPQARQPGEPPTRGANEPPAQEAMQPRVREARREDAG